MTAAKHHFTFTSESGELTTKQLKAIRTVFNGKDATIEESEDHCVVKLYKHDVEGAWGAKRELSRVGLIASMYLDMPTIVLPEYIPCRLPLRSASTLDG